jgi:hypothetical protein
LPRQGNPSAQVTGRKAKADHDPICAVGSGLRRLGSQLQIRGDQDSVALVSGIACLAGRAVGLVE